MGSDVRLAVGFAPDMASRFRGSADARGAAWGEMTMPAQQLRRVNLIERQREIAANATWCPTRASDG